MLVRPCHLTLQRRNEAHVCIPARYPSCRLSHGATGSTESLQSKNSYMPRVISISVMVAFNCLVLFAQTTNLLAPGGPGQDAHWMSAAKQGFGTSNNLRSKV